MRTLVSAPSAASAKAEVYINMQTFIVVPQLKFVMFEKGVVQLVSSFICIYINVAIYIIVKSSRIVIDELLEQENSDGEVERDDDTAFASIGVQNVSLNFESFNNGNTICPIVSGNNKIDFL